MQRYEGYAATIDTQAHARMDARATSQLLPSYDASFSCDLFRKPFIRNLVIRVPDVAVEGKLTPI